MKRLISDILVRLCIIKKNFNHRNTSVFLHHKNFFTLPSFPIIPNSIVSFVKNMLTNFFDVIFLLIFAFCTLWGFFIGFLGLVLFGFSNFLGYLTFFANNSLIQILQKHIFSLICIFLCFIKILGLAHNFLQIDSSKRKIAKK